MNLTTIVALLSVGGLVFLIPSVRGRLNSILSWKQGAHKVKQEHLHGQVDNTKKEIERLQNKVDALDEKAKVTTGIIHEVVKSGNKKVGDVLKEPKMEKLLEEFDKW